MFSATNRLPDSDVAWSEAVLFLETLKGLKLLHRFSNELARNAVGNAANTIGIALVNRLASAADAAFLMGDGTAGTITGLANAAGVQSTAATGLLTVDKLHDAFGAALAANAQPSAWFLHPRDLTNLRKQKVTDEICLVQPDPTVAGASTLLGLPVRTSTALAEPGSGTRPASS